MKKWCSGMSCRSGRGTNSEYLRRRPGTNSRTVPFCSKICPFHSLRKTIGVPGSQEVSRSEPYCHCLTRAGTVNANQVLLAGARIFTIESVVFTWIGSFDTTEKIVIVFLAANIAAHLNPIL